MTKMRLLPILAGFLILPACSNNTVKKGTNRQSDAGNGQTDMGVTQDYNNCGTCSPDPGPCWCGPGDVGDVATADMSSTSSDAGSGSDTSSTNADMSVRYRGTCTSDGDCSGGSCVAFPDSADGYHACAKPFPDPSELCDPVSNGGTDQCCFHSDCTDQPGGQCAQGPLFYCGGPARAPQNVCVYDECSSDADCTQGPAGSVATCVPRGVFGEPVSHCTYGDCQFDADCTSRTGGQCSPFFNPCNQRFIGFHCTYDDSACRSDGDCQGTSGGMQYCAPGDDGASTCQMFVPPV